MLPLDKARLPNLKNINPAYLNTDFDKGKKYSVPYAYTLTLLGYKEQKMKISVDSWAAIFDPPILAKIKGKGHRAKLRQGTDGRCAQVSWLFHQ